MDTTLLNLILVAPDVSLAIAFKEAFSHLPNVEVVNDYFEWLKDYDCLVSPANSFGMMDGGMDAAITQFFGLELERRVQAKILEDYLGEQPIGTSLIVETGQGSSRFGKDQRPPRSDGTQRP